VTRWAAVLGAAVAVLALVVGLTQRATRATIERDAAQDRVRVLQDVQEIGDDVDDLARDGDALRRELDSRLSGSDPR
jgi:lysylphosphatidylglycerol synthetase-like protein (DUF2156 family)